MHESLLIGSEGRLRRLTLNRPDKRNALNIALCRDLVAGLREAGGDPGVGAILLDAQGAHFCAGMDLSEVLEADPEETLRLHLNLFSAGARLRKPMVAVVQGAALSGGLGLALNAHIVVAASDAKFGLTETRIGLWPYVIFQAIAAATGARKATEMALTARILSAEEALRLGIVDFIVEPEGLAQFSLRLANELAEASTDAVAEGLSFIQQSRGMGTGDAFEAAAGFRREVLASPDFREGVQAFREKRKPVWPSHRRRE